MESYQFDEMKRLLQENILLKEKLVKSLNEKEKLINLFEEILDEKENLNNRYENLKKSKLGKLTIWYWKMRKNRKEKK